MFTDKCSRPLPLHWARDTSNGFFSHFIIFARCNCSSGFWLVTMSSQLEVMSPPIGLACPWHRLTVKSIRRKAKKEPRLDKASNPFVCTLQSRSSVYYYYFFPLKASQNQKRRRHVQGRRLRQAAVLRRTVWRWQTPRDSCCLCHTCHSLAEQHCLWH